MTTNKTIKININGAPYHIAEGASVAEAITVLRSAHTEIENDVATQSFVIALNQNFVPRSQYQEIRLQDSDAIELLSPMAGG